MKFHLKMDLSNAAFSTGDPREASALVLAEELKTIANQIAERHDAVTRFQTGKIADVNGNTIGRWTVGE